MDLGVRKGVPWPVVLLILESSSPLKTGQQEFASTLSCLWLECQCSRFFRCLDLIGEELEKASGEPTLIDD